MFYIQECKEDHCRDLAFHLGGNKADRGGILIWERVIWIIVQIKSIVLSKLEKGQLDECLQIKYLFIVLQWVPTPSSDYRWSLFMQKWHGRGTGYFQSRNLRTFTPQSWMPLRGQAPPRRGDADGRVWSLGSKVITLQIWLPSNVNNYRP